MSEPIGVAELMGIAVNGKQFQSSRLMHSVIVSMGWTKGTVAQLGLELTRMRAGLQAKAWKPAKRMFVEQIEELAQRAHWPIVAASQLRSMAACLLREWLFDVCPACLGRGIKAIETYQVSETTKEEVCPECMGSRKSSHRWQDRAKAVSVGRREYEEDWAGRFNAGIEILNGAYNEASFEVGKRLRREILDS